MISKAAFEVDDYCRIVEILHKRLVRFDGRNWRPSYKALIVLEHMLTHGPERVAEEFQCDRDVVREMKSFQHVDEKGFNWGLNVRKKSERILKLLEKGPLLKEERDRARKVSRVIQGFGSFSLRTSSAQETLQESSQKAFGRSNSEFNDHTDQEDCFSVTNENTVMKTTREKPLLPSTYPKIENSTPGSLRTQLDSKENLAPNDEVQVAKLHEGSWNSTREAEGEAKPLLGEQKEESRINISMGDHHPFGDADHLTSVSLLTARDEPQAC